MKRSSYTGNSGSEGDALKYYLNEISTLIPLTREEEQQLAKDGKEEDLDTLVRHNLKYVVMVASRYKGMGLSLADLVNEGNIGLVEAAKRFDHTRGVKFITYAIWWVKQSILRALAEQSGVVRLPVKRAGLLSNATKVIERLTHKNGKEPSVDEVAAELGVKLKTLITLMRVYRDYLSLDTPISSEDDTLKFIDILESPDDKSIEEDYCNFRLQDDILRILADLSDREKDVIRMRYGFDAPPMTLAEVGEQLGLTRERIRQIEKVAKDKLRTKSNITLLKEYMS
ncbi:MAG: sigma-70 family RNA polymerase sigma factor [Nitrospinota bacterium]